MTSDNVTYGGVSTSTNPAGAIPTKYLPATSPGGDATIDFRNKIPGKESSHKVLWRVYDGCHNSTQCIETIEIRDRKATDPILCTFEYSIDAGTSRSTCRYSAYG
jgi:hypothetical protein